MADLVEAQEGQARLLLPQAERNERGPGSKEPAQVFFNPAMAVNRDVSALLLRAVAKPGWRALDGLAASGVRGVRYGLETGVPLEVEWNDWNPLAVKLIEDNAKRNGLEPRVHRRNLASLLHEDVWHVVDVDPYGSPAPFFDAAGRAVRHGGLLGVTATDTMALAGVYPAAAFRRYQGRPMHGELGHEIALRLLVGGAVRAAARHEVALTPVVCHATDYYYRAILRAGRGAARADAALARIGHAFSCRACGERGFDDARACPACGGKTEVAGPLWTGPLEDAETLDAMHARREEATYARPVESQRLVELLREEARAPPLFHGLDHVSERERVGSAPRQMIVDALRAMGYAVGPVHFTRLGIRTDAPAKDVARAVREASVAAGSGR